MALASGSGRSHSGHGIANHSMGSSSSHTTIQIGATEYALLLWDDAIFLNATFSCDFMFTMATCNARNFWNHVVGMRHWGTSFQLVCRTGRRRCRYVGGLYPQFHIGWSCGNAPLDTKIIGNNCASPSHGHVMVCHHFSFAASYKQPALGKFDLASTTRSHSQKVCPNLGLAATMILVTGGAANASSTLVVAGSSTAAGFLSIVAISFLLPFLGGALALGLVRLFLSNNDEASKQTFVIEVLSHVLALRHFGVAAACIPAVSMVCLARVGALVAAAWQSLSGAKRIRPTFLRVVTFDYF
jgi:hypothetical protein